MRTRTAYSLVEILVVVAIIAVLLGILMPTLSKIRGLAERVNCASRLRSWAMIPLAYAQDNRGMLLQTMLQGEPWLSTRGNRYEPAHIWQQQQPAPANHEVSIPIIENYWPEIQQTGSKGGGVGIFQINSAWGCPAYLKRSGMTPWTASYGGAYMNFPGYMLLTHRSRSSHANISGQTLIHDRRAESAQVLMACTVFNWSISPSSAEFYHRSADGRLAGSSRAYGDGRVEWREMRDEHDKVITRMPTPSSLMNVATRYYW